MLKKFPYLFFENLKKKILVKIIKIENFKKNIDEKKLKLKNDFHD